MLLNPPFAEWGGPAFFGPMAGSCLSKRVASITRIAESEAELLAPLKAAGIDHGVEDSLRFAAALTSIKMESTGPFKGSLEEVMMRMND
jgi:hypothetical protein